MKEVLREKQNFKTNLSFSKIDRNLQPKIKNRKVESKSFLRKAGKIAIWIISIFMVIALIPMIVSVLPIKDNIEILLIESGSMEPTIKVGSIAISKPLSNYKNGDIISFSPDAKTIITHRISEIDYTTGKVVTKGDANEEVDQTVVTPAKIKGKILFWIPLLGYVVNFSKTITGFAAIIALPALIIVADELIGIKKAFIELKTKNENRR